MVSKMLATVSRTLAPGQQSLRILPIDPLVLTVVLLCQCAQKLVEVASLRTDADAQRVDRHAAELVATGNLADNLRRARYFAAVRGPVREEVDRLGVEC